MWSSRLIERAALLVAAVIGAGCGTGISVDPMSFERPTKDAGDDGNPAEPGDGATSNDVTDPGKDAGAGLDGASSDRRTDASALPDGAGDTGAIGHDVAQDGAEDDARDGSSDAGGEVSADVGVDRGGTGDVSVDRSIDAAIDGDAASDSVVRDVAGESSDVSDVASDAVGEAGTADAIDGCAVGCGQAEFDYYVDANAALGGDGSKDAPFRTISAAVDAHVHATPRARKAYVAEGTYDEALGEIFPLVLRGLSLQGAGADKTLIVGSGMFDHANQGGPKNLQYMVTVVAGDRTLPTKVSRLTMRPVAPVPAPGYFGLFCDRGNASGEVASPAGQTIVDEVTVGPGFDINVVVTPSTLPSVTGCNMLMTRSTVTGGWMGVQALGCDGSDTPGPVMLQMGSDDPASGNSVTWMRGEGAQGVGVTTGSCVVRASFQYNTISDSTNGLQIEEYMVGPTPGSPHPFTIKHNSFERMSNMGLNISGIAITIDELSDNRFTGTTRLTTSNERAFALRLYAPIVGKVRRNYFAGNDVGILFEQGAEQTDLGRPGDPGENVFLCNSGIDNWAGGDVTIRYPPMMTLSSGAPRIRGPRFVRDDDGGADAADGDDGGDAGVSGLPFAGNSWDHVPPRIGDYDLPTNGDEIVLQWVTDPLVFDFSGATLLTTPCPAGRVP